MLPGKDGFELVDEFTKRNIPVIFLTAKDSTVDKVKGLKLGAEDYITKPFDPMELLARVEVVLRRSSKNNEFWCICRSWMWRKRRIITHIKNLKRSQNFL